MTDKFLVDSVLLNDAADALDRASRMGGGTHSMLGDKLRAALDAKPVEPGAFVPYGWQLVPKEPSIGMVQSAIRHALGDHAEVYRSMLSTSPQPPVAPNIPNDLDQAQKRIAELEASVTAEKERAEYAWKNTTTIEAAYQKERVAREALTAENEKLRSQYNELIMAVARKYQDETRHETALRYIIEREAPKPNEVGCDAAKAKGEQ